MYEIAQGKAIDLRLSSERMYTVARCMDTCGKPLAMGATTKLQYLRRPSGYKDFSSKNWAGTCVSQAIADGPRRCRSHGVPVGMGMAVGVI